jgi:hypothetical protein
MTLKFYKQPLYLDSYSNWVYDAKHNFVFQFNKKNNDRDKMQEIIFSLNALYHEPIEELNLSIGITPTEILNNKLPFIEIRGWGNLTGIGGYNFDMDKASNIQDNFRDWIIYKLTNKKDIEL